VVELFVATQRGDDVVTDGLRQCSLLRLGAAEHVENFILVPPADGEGRVFVSVVGIGSAADHRSESDKRKDR
jgi:hypothetical protein